MKLLILLFTFLSCAGISMITSMENDNNIWLEEIESERALSWVKEKNAKTLDFLSDDPRFLKIKKKAYSYYTDQEKIPYSAIYNDGSVRNFWQDKDHVRGVMRKTSLKDYNDNKNNWETILDIDELAKKENKNWVYQGSQCLREDQNRCLLTLSDGGKDASVKREFDINKKSFIENGFLIPESKSGVSWLDKDTLLFGDGTDPKKLTSSGYPMVLKILKRGQKPESAKVLFEGKESDVSVSGWVSHHNNERIIIIRRGLTFYETEYYILDEDLVTIKKLNIPSKSNLLGIFKGKILISLQIDWNIEGETYKNGSLLALSKEGKNPQILFKPEKGLAYHSLNKTKDFIYLTYTKDVVKQILKLSYNQKWETHKFEVPDKSGEFYLYSEDEDREDFFLGSESPGTPPSIYYYDDKKGTFKHVLSRRHWFEGKDIEVHQHFTKSNDGTMVPYFLIHKKGLEYNSKNPTILYGYGGFEHSMIPAHNAINGMFWLDRGGVYVLSNIRGGGEYGPSWHQAALKENRQRAYDDFHSIAEDLIKREITNSTKLAIMGGSNGGLLTSVAFTQRPELYGAVISQVPITDMMRYHKLLAGASWMGEYGNPDIKEEKEYLLKYSPYHNIEEGKKYPKIFYRTSTKDDRVHPAHARKMVHRLIDKGYPVTYYENIEGGHGGAANLEQFALMAALEYVFLYQSLGM